MDEIKLIFDEEYVKSTIENDGDHDADEIDNFDLLMEDIQYYMKEDESLIEIVNAIIIDTAALHVRKSKKRTARRNEDEY